MKTAYLSSAYLAPVEYYTKLLAYDKIFVEQHDHYIKQTYRNRCTIAGPGGELALSIPTVKPDTLMVRNSSRSASVSPTTETGDTYIGTLSNPLTTVLLSLNTTKMISALSTRRNMSFWSISTRNFVD